CVPANSIRRWRGDGRRFGAGAALLRCSARPQIEEARRQCMWAAIAGRTCMAEQIGDILRNGVRDKLARGEVVASMAVRLVRNVKIARIAKTAGFDTLYIDVEHSSFSLETTSQICIAALAVGIAPFVRVPSIRPEHVGRVLDGGALGVIAPHVCSVEEARAVVRAAKFPPLGERSAAGGLPHLQYRSFPQAEANQALKHATT